MSRYVLGRLQSEFANTGGFNWRSARFSGNLLNKNIGERDFLGIMNAIILPNGIRKTTAYGRNLEPCKQLVESGVLKPSERSLAVLDIGSSGGVDALGVSSYLNKAFKIRKYVLGDICPRLFLDLKTKRVFDSKGNLIQIKFPLGFVSMYFECPSFWNKVLSIPRRIVPWIICKFSAKSTSMESLVPIDLAHPNLRLGSLGTKFELKEMDVFGPIKDKFDLILCMHLLVPRYFSSAKIRCGIENLISALNPGGVLVVGSVEAYSVFKMTESGDVQQVL